MKLGVVDRQWCNWGCGLGWVVGSSGMIVGVV